MAAKEKPAPVHDAGLGALTNVFNKTNAVENERFQYRPTAAETCWLGFLAMHSVTPTVENETLDKLFCSWAMWVLSPHALVSDETDKEKWENTKKKWVLRTRKLLLTSMEEAVYGISVQTAL